jgi:hypothetical protein
MLVALIEYSYTTRLGRQRHRVSHVAMTSLALTLLSYRLVSSLCYAIAYVMLFRILEEFR